MNHAANERQALSAGLIGARIERLPISPWHVRARILIGTATFFDAFDALATAQALPVIVPAWHLSSPQAGFVISAAYVGQIAGSLFFGWLAERHGRVRALALAITIFATMSVACGSAADYHQLLVFRIIQGFGLGGEVPIAATYISEIAKADGRGKFVLLYENLFAFGLVISGFIGSLVVPTFGWRVMFFAGALPLILVPIMLARLPESPRWLAARGRLDEADAALTRIEAEVSRTKGPLAPVPPVIPVEQIKGSWRDILGPGNVGKTVVVWTLWFTGYLVYYGLGTWMPTLYRTVFGLDVAHSLRLGMFANFAVFGGSLACALLIDTLGRRRLFVVTLVGEGASLLLLWAIGAQSVEQVAILTSLACFFAGSAGISAYLYTPEVYPTRSRAMATALGSSWLRLASMLGPSIVGLMVGGGIGNVFLLFAIVPLVASTIVGALAVETAGRSLEEISA
jgi:putative MFS transporter